MSSMDPSDPHKTTRYISNGSDGSVKLGLADIP